jgi:ABC-type multidrug transport system fused ATPase/permease subunit
LNLYTSRGSSWILLIQMTSVERVNQYMSLPREEDKHKINLQPPETWPQNGQIIFDDVSFAYDVSLEDALKNVSFQIDGGEKIGIVGRSGSGKSTIFQTIFRMAEPKGVAIIDGINIKDVSLFDLRTRISIIPVSCL